MNLIVIIVLIFLNLFDGCISSQDYSTSGEEVFQEQFFSSSNDNHNLNSDAEAYSFLNLENDQDNIVADVQGSPNPFIEEDEYDEARKENEYMKENYTHLNLQISRIIPTEATETSDKILLGNLKKINQDSYNNFRRNNEIADFNAAPMRREINIWQDSDEMLDRDMSWNYDIYYSPEKNIDNEFSDFNNPSMELTEQRNSSFLAAINNARDPTPRLELPQYFQKNYYYNYYPMVTDRKYYNKPKWISEDEKEITKNHPKFIPHKYIRKNPCKQYLQFLKYAFEKLDENPDYLYDYNENSNDDSETWKEQYIPKNQKVFTSHMLGPTLYIDNSGKISETNSIGNSVQNFKRVSSKASLTVAQPPKGEIKTKPTTFSPFSLTTYFKNRVMTTPPNFKYFNERHPTTGRTWTKVVTKVNSTSSNSSKSIFREETRTGVESKIDDISRVKYPETKNRINYRVNVEPQLGQKFDGSNYKTTAYVGTEEEQTDFDEFDYNDLKTTISSFTTVSPFWLFPQEIYQNLGNSFERKNKFSVSDALSENTTSLIEFSNDGFRRNFPSSSTAIPLGHTGSLFDTNTVELAKDSTLRSEVFEKKDGVDCNDKMLPCPDTFNITYPLNGYCNRYVSCEAGRAIRRICPDGLHFNIITKNCDLPHNSFCTYVCPEADGYYGIPGDCGGYFVCKKSIPEYRMCPPKMHWDIHKGICTFVELSSCPMKCSQKNEVKQYQGDCKAYIICLHGIPYYHKCPPNTIFDEKVLTCVPNQSSKCQNDPKLLTKNLNTNILCRDIEVKLNSKVWCNFFETTDKKAQRP